MNRQELTEYANSEEYKQWWEKFFPEDCLEWHDDAEHQYAGQDALYKQKHWMEFKFTFESAVKYPSWISHMLAEVGHHKNGVMTTEKGWIDKDLKCEFLVYGWEHINHIYIINWKKLQEWYKRENVKDRDKFYAWTDGQYKGGVNVRVYWNEIKDFITKIKI